VTARPESGPRHGGVSTDEGAAPTDAAGAADAAIGPVRIRTPRFFFFDRALVEGVVPDAAGGSRNQAICGRFPRRGVAMLLRLVPALRVDVHGSDRPADRHPEKGRAGIPAHGAADDGSGQASDEASAIVGGERAPYRVGCGARGPDLGDVRPRVLL